MKIKYRQGVLSHQTSPFFLDKTGNKIFIRANSENTLITIAFGNIDFLYAETEDILAWTGLFAAGKYWLYWDIDLETGTRTFGKTEKEPMVDFKLPDNPSIDQHVFLRSNNKMQVWDGLRWNTVARVFAGIVESNAVTPYNILSSQAGLNYESRAGFLLFDQNGYLIKTHGGEPLNTETSIMTQSSIFNDTKLSSNIIPVKSKYGIIPKYKCVSWVDSDNTVETTSSKELRRCNAVTLETVQRGENARVITQGYITDLVDLNWAKPPNTPLFVGNGGELTTEPPTTKSSQRVGYIVDKHTVYIKIEPLILIDPPLGDMNNE